MTGCEKQANQEEQVNNKFIDIEANEDGKIVIDTEEITSIATFVNYEVDDVIIQFIVVRGTDGEVRNLVAQSKSV